MTIKSEFYDERDEFIMEINEGLTSFPFVHPGPLHPRLADFIAGFLAGRGYRKIGPAVATRMVPPDAS